MVRQLKVPEQMTLRQHYAGLSLQGLLAAPDLGRVRGGDIVEAAVKYADALIAELERTK